MSGEQGMTKESSEAKDPQLQTETSEPGRLTKLGRRAFIISAAAAVSAVAFWGLRRSTVAAARPLRRGEGPANVTIVEFSADGKKTGTVTVHARHQDRRGMEARSSPPIPTGSRATRTPSAPSPGVDRRPRARHLSLHLLRPGPLHAPRPSSIPAPAGPASGSPSRRRTWSIP